MAGRAGRRGLDPVGTVIIACWDDVSLPRLPAQREAHPNDMHIPHDMHVTHDMHVAHDMHMTHDMHVTHDT